jgi:hypothetical protein
VATANSDDVGGLGDKNRRSFVGSGVGQYPDIDQTPPELVRKQLGEEEARQLWSWYRADRITEEDVAGGKLEDNAEVLVWRDVSGNDRHWYANSDEGDRGPSIFLRGPGVRPTLKFNGSDQSMVTGLNNGTERAFRHSQKTAIPGYTDCLFHLFMVLRRARRDICL